MRPGGSERTTRRPRAPELGRRLLALDRRAAGGAAPVRRPFVPLALALLVPLGAIALYGAVGAPGARDLPVSARAAPTVPPDEAQALLARAEAHLAQNPDDARGWAVVAPIYRRMGDEARAAAAFERGLPALQGADRAHALTELGEIAVGREGRVGEGARARFAEALRLDPANDKAGFYLASYAEQTGGREAGLAAWRGLVERHRLAGPAWLPAAERRIAALETMTLDATRADAPGPDASDVAAAARMDAGERSAMIEDMVAGLAARLEAEPDDPEGWERLVRSYMVLDRPADARAALARADAALVEGTADLAALRAQLRAGGGE